MGITRFHGGLIYNLRSPQTAVTDEGLKELQSQHETHKEGDHWHKGILYVLCFLCLYTVWSY